MNSTSHLASQVKDLPRYIEWAEKSLGTLNNIYGSAALMTGTIKTMSDHMRALHPNQPDGLSQEAYDNLRMEWQGLHDQITDSVSAYKGAHESLKSLAKAPEKGHRMMNAAVGVMQRTHAKLSSPTAASAISEFGEKLTQHEDNNSKALAELKAQAKALQSAHNELCSGNHSALLCDAVETFPGRESKAMGSR